MREERSIRARGYFPHAVVTTAVVAVLPIAVVWKLRTAGVISSTWLSIALAIALSLAVSALGSAYWRRRPSSGDIVFGELLIWGWLARVRVERQIERATRELRLDGAHDAQPSADAGRSLHLLTQLAAAIEAHDPFLDGHSHRVARYSAAIAHNLGLPAEEVRRISRAAAVHDIGKLRVPREVLMKPGALTDEEYEIVKRHSAFGADMVAALGDPVLTEMVRYHHERLDGSGYPSGLDGEAIPLGARIIAVADTFDAIASPRPYRPAARHKRAIDILQDEAGVALDPAAVRAFISYYTGSRWLAVWAALAMMPQRALALVRPGAAAGRTVALAPAAATMAVSAVVATMVPAGAMQLRSRPGPAPVQLTARVSPLTAVAAPTATHATGTHRAHHRRGAKPAPKVHKALAVLVAQTPQPRRASVLGAPVTTPTSTATPSPPPAPAPAPAPSSPPRSRAPGASVPAPLPAPTHTTQAPAPTAPSPPPPATAPTPTTTSPSPPPPTTTPTPTPTPTPPPSGPSSKSQCFHDGWQQWGFPNQGQCVQWVEHH